MCMRDSSLCWVLRGMGAGTLTASGHRLLCQPGGQRGVGGSSPAMGVPHRYVSAFAAGGAGGAPRPPNLGSSQDASPPRALLTDSRAPCWGLPWPLVPRPGLEAGSPPPPSGPQDGFFPSLLPDGRRRPKGGPAAARWLPVRERLCCLPALCTPGSRLSGSGALICAPHTIPASQEEPQRESWAGRQGSEPVEASGAALSRPPRSVSPRPPWAWGQPASWTRCPGQALEPQTRIRGSHGTRLPRHSRDGVSPSCPPGQPGGAGLLSACL